ncbi:helix-turn-helix domain-containing GNAT family N-acetyltransferase [Streptomyces sp. PmtG]
MSVQEIRSFNRFYANLIGSLDRHLYAPYTLTESRVLYELAHSARTDAADLRAALSLDAGYLSRILAKFEEDGLVGRTRSERDTRRRRVTLTARGRQVADLLDERSRESVGALVAKMPAAERERLTAAMATVREILAGAGPAPRGEDVALREPGAGELGWIVQRNGALYAAEFGWNAEYEGLVAQVVADFARDHAPHVERVWIADLDGRPVGCVMCVRDEAPGAARLRLLLVEPEVRGLGIGQRLVREAIGFAREVGYRELVLWTSDVLDSARALCARHGFVMVDEKACRAFGADLVGQTWRLPLRSGAE